MGGVGREVLRRGVKGKAMGDGRLEKNAVHFVALFLGRARGLGQYICLVQSRPRPWQKAIADRQGRPLTCVATHVEIKSRPLISPLAYQVRYVYMHPTMAHSLTECMHR